MMCNSASTDSGIIPFEIPLWIIPCTAPKAILRAGYKVARKNMASPYTTLVPHAPYPASFFSAAEEASFGRKVVTIANGLASVFVIFVYIAANGANDILPFIPQGADLGLGLFWTMCFFPAVVFFVLGILGGPSSWITLAKETIEFWWEFRNTRGNIFVGLLIRGPAKIIGNLLQIMFLPAALLFQEPCLLYGPPKDQLRKAMKTGKDEEFWMMINGVATTYDVADRNRVQLFKMFGRPVHMLHNPTESIFFDLMQCIAGKLDLFEKDIIKPRMELYGWLVMRLENTLERKNRGDDLSAFKIVLVAHSQGTIITGNVLTILQERNPDLRDIMKEYLYVFNFATCGHRMPGHAVKHLENISNKGDFVAYLGQLFPFPSFWRNSKNETMQIQGESIVQPGRWGHLLNSHYLIPMEENKNLYKGSILKDPNFINPPKRKTK